MPCHSFWSQHYDVPINYVGHAEQWDEIEIDGDIKARDCLLRYKRNGRELRRRLHIPRCRQSPSRTGDGAGRGEPQLTLQECNGIKHSPAQLRFVRSLICVRLY
jgi:hypothetical protein